ncbi:hypothetical protein HK101_003646, partial [Irineochytrium annulatum]
MAPAPLRDRVVLNDDVAQRLIVNDDVLQRLIELIDPATSIGAASLQCLLTVSRWTFHCAARNLWRNGVEGRRIAIDTSQGVVAVGNTINGALLKRQDLFDLVRDAPGRHSGPESSRRWRWRIYLAAVSELIVTSRASSDGDADESAVHPHLLLRFLNCPDYVSIARAGLDATGAWARWLAHHPARGSGGMHLELPHTSTPLQTLVSHLSAAGALANVTALTLRFGREGDIAHLTACILNSLPAARSLCFLRGDARDAGASPTNTDTTIPAPADRIRDPSALRQLDLSRVYLREGTTPDALPSTFLPQFTSLTHLRFNHVHARSCLIPRALVACASTLVSLHCRVGWYGEHEDGKRALLDALGALVALRTLSIELVTRGGDGDGVRFVRALGGLVALRRLSFIGEKGVEAALGEAMRGMEALREVTLALRRYTVDCPETGLLSVRLRGLASVAIEGVERVCVEDLREIEEEGWRSLRELRVNGAVKLVDGTGGGGSAWERLMEVLMDP